MNVQLKPLDEQVIVVTGATSGIGLTTARMAADRGARVVLVARSEDALRELTREIERDGGEATFVTADVRDRDDVREVVRTAEETYGGFDTWVNDAGAFLYGRLRETPVEDMREQFETNVWGLLYGTLEAADHLERRGGAIVNVGSLVSERAMPLQGSYSASKHAVKGFTDSLRMELEEAGAPISVTLVEPASIDTPYPEHAKNHMDAEARLPPPIYAPETVARTILDAAETPQRDVLVGGAAKNLAQLSYYAPGFLDTVMEKLFFDLQRQDEPPSPGEDNIDEPTGELRERGEYDGYTVERSLYTRLVQRRDLGSVAAVALGAVALAVYAASKLRGRRSSEDGRVQSEDTDVEVQTGGTAPSTDTDREFGSSSVGSVVLGLVAASSWFGDE